MVQSFRSCWPSLRNFFILFFAIGKLAAQEAMTAQGFVEGMHEVLLNNGTAAADLYLRQYAEAGLDLAPLRKTILDANAGKRQKIEVPIHPMNSEIVPFMQEQMEAAHYDFVELVPVIDESLPAPDKPFKEDALSYAAWTKARMGIVSTISFLVVMAGAAAPDMAHGGIEAVQLSKLITAAVQGLFVVSVELLTSHFSSALNTYLWSPKRFQEPSLSAAELEKRAEYRAKLEPLEARLKARVGIVVKGVAALMTAGWISPSADKSESYVSAFSGIFGDTTKIAGHRASFIKEDPRVATKSAILAFSKLLNRSLIDSTNDIHGKPRLIAGFYYINIFNFVYATSIFAAGSAASYFTGVHWDSFGHMFLPTVGSTLGFYFALAMNQNLLGRLHSYGRIRETMRLKCELISLYLAKPGRLIATIPGPSLMILGIATEMPMFQVLGIVLQVGAGLLGTYPAFRELRNIRRFARETGEMFDRNENLPEEEKLKTTIKFKESESTEASGNFVSRLFGSCAWLLKGGHLRSGARLVH